MQVDATVIQAAVFVGVLTLVLVGGSLSGRSFLKGLVEQYLKSGKDEPVWRLVQIRGRGMEPVTEDDVFVVDCRGNRWVPDREGFVNVPVGPITVFNARDGKVVKVVALPEEGASPYQVILSGIAKGTTDSQ